MRLFSRVREARDLTEAGKCLGSQLADPGLGHPQLNRDVAEGALFEEGAGEDEAFPVGQLVECLANDPFAVRGLEGVADRLGFIADAIRQRMPTRLPFERDGAGREGPLAPPVDRGVVDAEVTGDFAGRGGAAEALLALGGGAIEPSGVGPVHS